MSKLEEAYSEGWSTYRVVSSEFGTYLTIITKDGEYALYDTMSDLLWNMTEEEKKKYNI